MQSSNDALSIPVYHQFQNSKQSDFSPILFYFENIINVHHHNKAQSLNEQPNAIDLSVYLYSERQRLDIESLTRSSIETVRDLCRNSFLNYHITLRGADVLQNIIMNNWFGADYLLVSNISK